MKRLNIIIITILICALSQAQNPPYRNGQRLTDYNFPLFGDVKTIEYTRFSINTYTGEEYLRDTTIIRFNKNGDVEYINPYVDLTYTDVVYPAELRFLYNNLGYNTLTREVIDYDYMDVVYDTYYTYVDYTVPLNGQPVSIWIYDMKANELRKSDIGEFITYKDAGADCTKTVARYNSGHRLFIIYK